MQSHHSCAPGFLLPIDLTTLTSVACVRSIAVINQNSNGIEFAVSRLSFGMKQMYR